MSSFFNLLNLSSQNPERKDNTLKENNFEIFWKMQGEFVEEPNIRKGGMSGVITVDTSKIYPNGKVYIKRQENHNTRTFLHPFKGIPTIQREVYFSNLCSKSGIKTLEILYWQKKKYKAIMITKELLGFISLDEYFKKKNIHQHRREYYKLIANIAQSASQMHKTYVRHNCFYPKHIFLHPDSQEVAFIDFEKARYCLSRKQCAIRDLDVLNRYLPLNISNTDRLRFMFAYLNIKTLNKSSKKLISKILQKSKKKI